MMNDHRRPSKRESLDSVTPTETMAIWNFGHETSIHGPKIVDAVSKEHGRIDGLHAPVSEERHRARSRDKSISL